MSLKLSENLHSKCYEGRYKVLRNIEQRGTCSTLPKREVTSQHKNKYPDNLNTSLWYLKISEIFFDFYSEDNFNNPLDPKNYQLYFSSQDLTKLNHFCRYMESEICHDEKPACKLLFLAKYISNNKLQRVILSTCLGFLYFSGTSSNIYENL